MNGQGRTNQELLEEISVLKMRIKEQEQSETRFKQIDEMLHLSNEITTNMSEGVILVRVDNRTIVYANPKFENMLGYEHKELKGKCISIINAPSDRTPEEVTAEIATTLRDKGAWHGEVYNRRKDGTAFWCFANVSTFKHPTHGEVWVAIHADITERKRAEQELWEQYELQRVLLEAIPAYVYVKDRHSTYLLGNKQFSELSGIPENEISGKTDYDFFSETDADRFRKDDAEIIARGRAKLNYEVKGIDTKGNAIWYSTSKSPFFEPSGRKSGLVGICFNITEQKRAKEALRESEEKFRLLVENSHDIIYSLTGDGVFIFVSLAWTRLLGHPVTQVVGKPFQPFVHPDDVPGCMKFLKSVIETGQRQKDVEYRIQHIDGTWYWHTSSAVPFKDEAGVVTGFYGIARDITDRKQAEANKEKLETQNRQIHKVESLVRMAGAIAHSFNNHLASVVGNLEMVIDKLPESSKLVLRLNESMKAAWKAAEISKLMLTYIGQTPGKQEPLDLSEACRQSLPMFQAVMPGNVFLETDLPHSGPIISANLNQMQQVLSNLITNAWEAIGEGRGTIYLSVQTVSPVEIPLHRFPIDWQPQNNVYACLKVTDTGNGIAGNDIEKLCDPFFSTKFTGRGMGLAVVTGIVRAHNGAVTIESEPGRGSIFRVFFPVSTEEIIWPMDSASRTQEIYQGGTVLLVDDNEMMRNTARSMFKRLDISIFEAKDGCEAVDICKQHQNEIDFVLCDLTMPGMNGWETLTALRKLAPDIPVILASGYDEAKVMEGEHTESPQALLAKPYKLKDLSYAINQALGGKK